MPILLGTFVIASGVPQTERIYDIVFVAVAFSVIVQGGLVSRVAQRCKVPMRQAPLQPWGLDVRFSDEPQSLTCHAAAQGPPADGSSLRAIHHDHMWMSLVTRDGRMITLTGDTVLQAGDQIYLQIERDPDADPDYLFGNRVDRDDRDSP